MLRPAGVGKSDWFGIIMLFLVMMLSGGNHLFPRNPVCLLVMAGYGFRIYTFRNGITLRYISTPTGVFVLLFLLIIAFQAILAGQLDSAALAALSNVLAGLLVFTYYKLRGLDFLVADVTFLLKVFIILGLISFLCYTFIPDAFSKYTFTDSYGDTRTVYHLFFIFYKCVSYTGVLRLTGFFWEPGIFQIYLNLFLMLQLFFFKEKGWIIVALLSIYLTKSTTGYLITTLIILFVAIRFFYREKNLHRAVFLIITTVIVSFFMWNYILSVNVEFKMAGAESGSFFARQADLVAGVKIAGEHPVIGIGANTDRFKQLRTNIAWQGEYRGSQVAGKGSTNGMVSLFYTWGIPFAIWYLWGLIRQTVFDKSRWLMAILLILSLASEPLAMTPFFLLFVYSGIDKINNCIR